MPPKKYRKTLRKRKQIKRYRTRYVKRTRGGRINNIRQEGDKFFIFNLRALVYLEKNSEFVNDINIPMMRQYIVDNEIHHLLMKDATSQFDTFIGDSLFDIEYNQISGYLTAKIKILMTREERRNLGDNYVKGLKNMILYNSFEDGIYGNNITKYYENGVFKGFFDIRNKDTLEVQLEGEEDGPTFQDYKNLWRNMLNEYIQEETALENDDLIQVFRQYHDIKDRINNPQNHPNALLDERDLRDEDPKYRYAPFDLFRDIYISPFFLNKAQRIAFLEEFIRPH
jgi:hypothetical protein